MFSVSDALRKTFNSTTNFGNAYGVLLGNWGGSSGSNTTSNVNNSISIEGCLPLTLPKEDADVFKTLDVLYCGLLQGGGSSLPVGVVALGDEEEDDGSTGNGSRQQVLLEAIATSALTHQHGTKSVPLLAFTSLKQLVESSPGSTTTTAIPPILLQYSSGDSSSKQQLVKKASPFMLPKSKGGATSDSGEGKKDDMKKKATDESLASLMLKSQPQGNVLVCAPSEASATQIYTTVSHAAENNKNTGGLPPPPLVLSTSSSSQPSPSFYLPVTSAVANANDGDASSSASLELILWLHKSKKDDDDDDGKVNSGGVPTVIMCNSMAQLGNAPSSSSPPESMVPLYFGPIERFVVSTAATSTVGSNDSSNGVYWVCVGGEKSADVLYLPIRLSEDNKKSLVAALNPKVVSLRTLDGKKVSPATKAHTGCCGPPSGPDVKTAPAWAVYLLTAAMVLSTAVGMGLIITGGQEEAERRTRMENSK